MRKFDYHTADNADPPHVLVDNLRSYEVVARFYPRAGISLDQCELEAIALVRRLNRLDDA